MNRTELLERLDGTEGLDFELKSARGGVPDDAFKTLSAFANSGGGWIVFGVTDADKGYEIQGIAGLLQPRRLLRRHRRPLDRRL